MTPFLELKVLKYASMSNLAELLDAKKSLEIKDGLKGFRTFHLNAFYQRSVIQSLLKAPKKNFKKGFSLIQL